MTLAGGQVAYRLRSFSMGVAHERRLRPARGWDSLRRRALRASEGRDRRGRLQHCDDRISGVGHRPVLRGPDHHLHLSADRQLRGLQGRHGVGGDPRPGSDHAGREEPRGRQHRRAWLAGLASRRRHPRDRRRRHEGAGPPHSRPGRHARGHISGGRRSRRCGPQVAAEPSMDGADLARTVTPPEPLRFDGDGPHVVSIDTASSSTSCANCASGAAG